MTIDAYASAVDTDRYGEYRVPADGPGGRPLYRFNGRVRADGSTPFRAEAGRYHLYAGWFCPWSHRATILIALLGLADTVSVSYVHEERDGRGWAFRAPTGVDPVNGFVLLREAFDSTQPGFDGHVSVPTLWDRASGTVVSNDVNTIAVDLASEFGQWAEPSYDVYPLVRRDEIDAFGRWLDTAVTGPAGPAAAEPGSREILLAAFAALDQLLERQRYLLGAELTLADVALWVTLVRYDIGVDADRVALSEFGCLRRYARELYAQPAFRATTDFGSFAEVGAAPDFLTGNSPRTHPE